MELSQKERLTEKQIAISANGTYEITAAGWFCLCSNLDWWLLWFAQALLGKKQDKQSCTYF